MPYTQGSTPQWHSEPLSKIPEGTQLFFGGMSGIYTGAGLEVSFWWASSQFEQFPSNFLWVTTYQSGHISIREAEVKHISIFLYSRLRDRLWDIHIPRLQRPAYQHLSSCFTIPVWGVCVRSYGEGGSGSARNWFYWKNFLESNGVCLFTCIQSSTQGSFASPNTLIGGDISCSWADWSMVCLLELWTDEESAIWPGALLLIRVWCVTSCGQKKIDVN
jgi:hypothetical protein